MVVYVGISMPQCKYGGQRITSGVGSSSTWSVFMWEFELRSSCLGGKCFYTSLPPQTHTEILKGKSGQSAPQMAAVSF